MGPPAASYVPRVGSRNGEHSIGATNPRRYRHWVLLVSVSCRGCCRSLALA
jgi:hypothetical protein